MSVSEQGGGSFPLRILTTAYLPTSGHIGTLSQSRPLPLPLALACSALCGCRGAREHSLRVGTSVGVRFCLAAMSTAIPLIPAAFHRHAAAAAAANPSGNGLVLASVGSSY